MTQLQLTQDEYRLFTITPDDGSPIGNVSARTRLGFPKNRYGRAKDGLLAKHLILRAPGGGGAIKRAPRRTSPTSSWIPTGESRSSRRRLPNRTSTRRCWRR